MKNIDDPVKKHIDDPVKINKRDILYKKTTIWANIVICIQLLGLAIALGMYIAFSNNNKEQTQRNERNEKTKNAIEAVNRVYNIDFLRSTSLVKTKHIKDTIKFIDATNHILNTYYVISIVYNSGIADNMIIGCAIKNELSIYVDSILKKDETDSLTLKSIIDMNDDIKLKIK